jgi:hypothetical protein
VTPTFNTSDFELWLSHRVARFMPEGDSVLTPAKGLAIAAHANDVLVGALTVLGEIRDGSYDAKLAVAHTFNNRQQQKPDRSVAGLCLAPMQYSCWTPKGGAGNYAWLLSLTHMVVTALDSGQAPGPQKFPHLHECMYLVGGVLTGALLDNTDDSTHYYVKGTKEPDWAKGRTPAAVVGPHLFFNHIAW